MDNKLLALILLVLASNKTNETTRFKTVGDYISTMEVDQNYTIEKMDILKKIGPYFPGEYIPLINRSILITEGILKISQLVELLDHDYDYIEKSIEVKNEKDRLNKIISTIQKETPKLKNNDLGMVMDLIINMDKYKSMFSILSSVMNNQDSLNDPVKLIDTLGPAIGLNIGKGDDKAKEMTKMMEIIKLLNLPKKEIPKATETEDKNIEIIEKAPKE